MTAHTIECPCGAVLRGGDVESVISSARAHASSVHAMDLSEADARSMARPAS